MTSFFFIEDLSPLYEEVQLSGIFSDSKYFVDAVPRYPANEITNAYSKEKTKPGFDLKTFLASQFELPGEPAGAHYQSGNKTITEHLQELWQVLRRSPDELGGTLIPLPYPYIVPGGRFREVYYWDSYFTMLGLKVSGQTDMIECMIRNFATLIDQVGFVPNGNRTYYLGRSQPPFFALMLDLLSSIKGDEALLFYQPRLLKEYSFWMNSAEQLLPGQAHRRVVRMPDGSLMNRYWDDKPKPRPEAYHEDVALAAGSDRPIRDVYRDIRAAAESGWDFSSRWFADPSDMRTIRTTSLVPVDLNCLLLFMEQTLEKMSRLKGDGKEADWNERATRRASAIRNYCWNESLGFFVDHDLETQQPATQPTLAGMAPLFFRVATADEAGKVSTMIAEKFLQPGGAVTTLLRTGQQWDAPNGWAPLQWICFRGLLHYGMDELAGKIRSGWMQLNESVYATTGKMMEKYNVMDTTLAAGGGEYPNQDGFGWTNGVYLQFSRLHS